MRLSLAIISNYACYLAQPFLKVVFAPLFLKVDFLKVDIYMDPKFTMFLQIMLFYILLSYVIMPTAFYFYYGKSLAAAGNGYVVGSLLSLIMWYAAGKNMVK